MPDLTLTCDPLTMGIAAILERVLPEVVLLEMKNATGEEIPLRHVNFRVLENRVKRTGYRYGYAYCLHIETKMEQFRGAGGRALGTAVRRHPDIASVITSVGGGLSVRVSIVDSTWSDPEDDK